MTHKHFVPQARAGLGYETGGRVSLRQKTCYASHQNRTPLPNGRGVLFWWAIKGSNLGPTGYEPVALTN